MKTILLFGAGKSASVLIEYLLSGAPENEWKLILVDADLKLAQTKMAGSPYGEALSFDVLETESRRRSIGRADLVISLLPPHLHIEVARDCIRLGKHLLTASYLNDEIRQHTAEIEEKGLLFLYEMGLDPGIDHMSAMSLLDTIRTQDGIIDSFISHCGGLVALESDNNPWHYKISWNPRNVVTAGKDGAQFKQDGKLIQLTQQQIFDQLRLTEINGAGAYAWYPNRDSLSYMPLYGLKDTPTFIRTTLRHPAFISGWKNLLSLGLVSDQPVYSKEDCSLADAWAHHFSAANMNDKLAAFRNASFEFNEQMTFLGIDDKQTSFKKNKFTPAELLQFALENKLKLASSDRDLILMQHEIMYTLKRKKYQLKSSLIVKGNDGIHTAMAKTVGLPLGIAASLLLNGTIRCRGLQVPVLKEIYQPVLKNLQKEGIRFMDTSSLCY